MRQSVKLNIVIISILALLVGVSVYWLTHQQAPKNNTAKAPVLVHLDRPKKIMLFHSISSSGNLDAIQTVTLSSKTSGYVTHIDYPEGAAVHSGERLIQLDDSKERAAVDSAQAQDDISALKYRQFSKIYREHFAAYDDYFGAKINHEKDHAALETAQTDLMDKRIRAPFAGVIGAQQIHVGDFIQPGAPLFTLTDLTKLRVTYSIPASDMDFVEPGQLITLATSALPNNLFHGRISYISPTVDAGSQTITVHADVDNPQQLLKPGLFVTIHQTLNRPLATLVIPSDTLFASLNGYYVLGAKEGKAYTIPVIVGQKLNQGVVIVHGLTATDLFITQGQTKVQAGDAITVNSK